jgi:hypothetical protein
MSIAVLRVVTLIAASGLVVSTPTVQQAQQGVASAPVGGTSFNSPMVLTASLAAVDRSLWGKGDWFSIEEYRELGKFTCDGVSLRRPDVGLIKKPWKSGLELAARLKDAGTVEVRVRLNVYNPAANHDKSVTVVIELLDGAVMLQSWTVGPLKVEDKGTGVKGYTALLVPLDRLIRQPFLSLRLTVMARDI